MQSLMMFVIVVINVKKKIKYVKNAFFVFKIKKNVCKRDKNVTLFLLAFDHGVHRAFDVRAY